MVATQSLAGLIAIVVREENADRALEHLAALALELTRSRNLMLAVINDEHGLMEIKYGAGEEWSRERLGEVVQVDVRQRDGIVGFVAATGQSLVAGNVQEEPRYRQLFESTVSEIAVPVRDRLGRIRAVLNAESDQLNAYTRDDLQLCEAIAQLVALIMEREELANREQALVMVGKALDVAETEEDLLEQVIRVADEVLRFQACSIFLLNAKSGDFVLRASIGRLKDRVGSISYRGGEGCTGWVCETGRPVRLDHPQQDPRWRGRFLEFASEQIASFLAVPIVIRGKSIGAIRVVRRVSENEFLDNRFTDSDERVLSAIADQLSSGLENVRNIAKVIRSERMAAWGELSAKSSHMIGNRVFALKGDVNEMRHALDSDTPDLKALRQLHESLVTNILRVDEILQDFRDFVTATQLERTIQELNPIVEETLREVFPRRTKRLLETELARDLPVLALDAKKLRRAISELVENSMNWVEEGVLRVATGLASQEELRRARLPDSRRFVKIEVEDRGPGVQQDQKEAIFQPFTSGRVKGMGLGLSIVRGIAEALGGTALESGEPGKGARFVILLPVPDRPNSETT